MNTRHKTPDLAPKLYKRIRLVRRDMSNLLFHFTRKPPMDFITIRTGPESTCSMPASASAMLTKILHDGKLLGTSDWTYGEKCVCFTEAPIQEFNSVFSLVELASSIKERPRYEPYGIAVPKGFLFNQGGRPVIYDHPSAFDGFPATQRYRFVPYNPEKGIDFTWEREWRIRTEELVLDPKKTLVVVPTSDEAFDVVYEFAKIEADFDVDGSVMGAYHTPKWLAVSLELFGVKP